MNSSLLRSEDHVNSENPWPGLAPYKAEDSAWFRGRSRELEDLVRRIKQNTLTLLFSRSGIGKSSLLRAALIPRLRLDAYLPIYVRLDFSESAPPLVGQIWKLLDGHVGLHPHYNPSDHALRPSLWEFFHDQQEGLLSPTLSGISIVLVFDQFEEIFTLGERTDESKRQVHALIEELADLAEGRPPARLQERFNQDEGEIERFDFDNHPGQILIALREDYLSHLERHRRRLPMVMENRMPLNPLSGNQALEAVTGPAPHLLDAEVAEHIVRFVGGDENVAMGELSIDPSLLNLICRELNAKRRALGQSKLTTELLGGSREEILEGFYDGCFLGLADQAQDFVEKELLTRSGYRESISEERAIERIGQASVDQLVNKRLLSVEERGGVRRVELSHDLLTEVAARRRDERFIREENERKAAEVRNFEARVEAARRKQVRVVRLAALMGLLFILAAVAAGFAWKKEREAQAARERANALAIENAERSSEADFLLGSEYHRTGRSSLALAHLARSLRSNPRNIQSADSALSLLLNPSTEVGWLPEFPALIHEVSVRSIAWSGNAKSFLSVAGSEVMLWNMPERPGATPTMAQTLKHFTDEGHEPIVRGAVWSPDGKIVVTWAADMIIRLWRTTDGSLLFSLKGHTDTINDVVFDSSGQWLASASYDHSVRLWQVRDGAMLRQMDGHKLCVNQVAFSPQGDRLASASDDGTIGIWNPLTGDRVFELDHQKQAVEAITFSHAARSPRLLATGAFGQKLWDWQTGQAIQTPPAPDAPVKAAISPDGYVIASSWNDSTGLDQVFGNGNGEGGLRWPHAEKLTSPEGLAFSPEGRRLIRFTGGSLRIWSTDTAEPFGKPISLPDPIKEVVWSPDARHIAVASGVRVSIWDGSERAPLVVAVPNAQENRSTPVPGKTPAGKITASFLKGGTQIGTSTGKVARIWSAQTGAPLGREISLEKIPDVCAFSPDGSVFVCCPGTLIRRYDTLTGRLIGEDAAHKEEIQNVTFSDDGRTFVSSSNDHTAKVWETRTGKPVCTIVNPSDREFASGRFSSTGERLIIIGYDFTAYVADARTGKLIGEPLRHMERINHAEFSQDGRFAITASDDRIASVWELATCTKLHDLPHIEGVYRASFSADGSLVATFSRDSRTLDLWDRATGRRIGKPLAHQKSIKGFSLNNGSRIATASSDGTAQIWDTSTGEPIGGSLEHVDGVNSVEFSDDGQTLLTTCADGKARVWETFSCGPSTPGSEQMSTPPWLPDLLDEATEIHLEGTSQVSRDLPSSTGLRAKLTQLSLPWQRPLLQQTDNFNRAAAWLSLNPETRTGAFVSRISAESERERLLDSTNATDVRRAFQLAPHLGSMQAALARFETDRERSDFLINFAMDSQPGDPETVFQASQALEKRSSNSPSGNIDLSRAESLLTEVLKSHPGNSHCLRALGWLRARDGAADDSKRLFEQAIKVTPNDPTLHEYYGFSLNLLGNRELALAQWRLAETLSPAGADVSDLRAGMAIGHWRLNHREEAKAAFTRLLETDPERDWKRPETIRELGGDWTDEEKKALEEMQASFGSAGGK